MARPKGRTQRKDKAFFEAIESGVKVKQASEACGYSYRSVMRYIKEDDDFRLSYAKAKDTRFLFLQEELYECITDGITETKITKNPRGTEYTKTTKKSPQLLMFALKAAEAGRFNFDREDNHGGDDQIIELNFEDV